MMRSVRMVLALLLVAAFSFRGPARAADCASTRLLVLSAMPVELGPILAQEQVEDTIVIDGRTFYAGTINDHPVVLAMTGIGMVNADTTISLALKYLSCIGGVVFSGTSGGQTNIGDVVVPKKWTPDNGTTWYKTSAKMRATAKSAAAEITLPSDAPIGDCACVGADPDAATFAHFDYTPTIIFPTSDHLVVGRSGDPFGDHALPCVPGGGDVFGCHPCRAPDFSPSEAPRFANGALPFLSPDFFTWYQEWSSATGTYDAEDMESAAVAEVAQDHKLPFIAFRALSDGKGDPFGLPGFPVEFFVYRQFAAENAATVALAFINAWKY